MDSLRRLAARARPLVFLALAIWIAHLVNVLLLHRLTPILGLEPRTIGGLVGIATMPFVHGSWAHLIANTAPLLTLGAMILLIAPSRFWPATVLVVGLGGALTWALGSAQIYHVGASGLIFGWFGFLVTAGALERSGAALIGAVGALVLYGAPTALGILAAAPGVSWEAHLFGLLAGIAAAWALQDPAARRAVRLRRR